ncbi:biotin-dependent carboxyltransferase family protein [Vibrio sp. ZSDE26]|uniref:Biotin-dependent carboxyltransferase family protein n=1 Tax=Vibrio amylolyticus TaxID=2847292 RepID=A0A9X1XJG4_9VIBR|nr:biotin-dependent carboxyltransferase family protein [Vibrio amylolyticus]MCK6263896.1 biotin-dependent carboxyltransferase family protein [Vibrio amylolyticus]
MDIDKKGLKVVKPGQLSLIQDYGRFGYSHLGVTQGGPVDDYAYSWANYLLGNPVNCATIEITLGQAEYEVLQPCTLAITGGDLGVTLNGVPINNWSTFNAYQGQTLKFGLAKNGLRSYLAVVGGFNVSPQLGSCSSVTRDKLGGLTQNGLPLKGGEILSFSPHHQQLKPLSLTFRFTPNYNLPLKLRVIESYQFANFSSESITRFYQQPFSVSQYIDRMGYRLTGGKIPPPKGDILSEGIALGSIQVPPSGEPIILLNDRQTIGGYPKLGCVARIDLPRLAQARPGQAVQFIKGDLAGLQDVWCQWARFFGY